MLTRTEPLSILFEDDGLVPNNPRLPLVIHRKAVALGADPEKTIESLFARNGWGDMWRNGIFDYLHYHATVHEALGVARGHALVLFGGERGEAIQVGEGDVLILPAGTGHKSLFHSHDFRVVGAYPPGAAMTVTLPTPDNYRSALRSIPLVALPTSDPVFGHNGPLMRLWR